MNVVLASFIMEMCTKFHFVVSLPSSADISAFLSNTGQKADEILGIF